MRKGDYIRGIGEEGVLRRYERMAREGVQEKLFCRVEGKDGVELMIARDRVRMPEIGKRISPLERITRILES